MTMKKLSVLLFVLMLLFGAAQAAENLDGGLEMDKAVAIRVDGSYIGKVVQAENRWYTFTADADDAFYRVDFKNEEIDTTMYVTLYDAQGIKIAEDDVSKGKTGYLSFKAEPGAQYNIKFRLSNQKKEGRFSLSLAKYPDVHGDTLETASTLQLNDTLLTSFDGTNDVDVFTFTAQEGGAFYRLDLKNENVDTTVYAEVLDANGLKLHKEDAANGKTTYISFKAEPLAQYYVKLYRNTQTKSGSYTLTLSRTEDKEADGLGGNEELPVDQERLGSFDGTNDVDVFAFTAAEGDAFYRIDLKNENADTTVYVEVLDSDGLKLYKADAAKGKTTYISFKAEPQARYYIKLYRSTQTKSGSYTLMLSRTEDRDADDMLNAVALALGEKSASFDGSGDVDYFTFTAGTQRAYYRLSLQNGSVESTTYMELQDAAGLKIKTVEAGKGKTGAYSFLAQAGAQYYLKLTRNDSKKLGEYIITVEEYLDPMGESAETALAITHGENVSGTIAGKEDADYFSVFAGEEDAMVKLTVAHISGSSRMNVVVYDSVNKEVASWRADVDGVGEKTLEMAAGTTYYVCVKSDNAGAYSVARTDLVDLGGSDILTAVAAETGATLELAFEMKADTDFVAFPEAGATIRVMATGDKTISVMIVDENGLTLQNETRVYAGDSRVYVAERKGAYLRIMGDGGVYHISCCTDSQHIPSEYYAVVKEASCSAEGLKEMYCTVCNDVVAAETIEKTEHRSSDSFRVSKYAACDDDGLQVKKCVNCGEVVEQETIPATGHQNSRWEITLQDTCTENGIQRRVCIDCGKQLEQEVITALGHVSSDWVIKKYPTCAESGRQVRECRVCYQVLEEQMLPMLGHQYGEWTVVKEPTGSEEGLQQQVCQTCGDTQSQTIEKKGIFGGLFGN